MITMNTISSTKTNLVGSGESQQPALDKTGQFAVFSSDATNLSTDTSGLSAIYLKNTQTGDLKTISNDKYGIAANTASLNPTISGDGRYVIFESTAVVSTDFNGSILFPFSDFDSRSQSNKGGVNNLFLKNTQTGDLTLVTPTFGDGDSVKAEITSDGKSVVFQSLASNFISNDSNGTFDIYVEDLQTKTLKLVSSDSSGTIGNRASVNPSVSADGLKVAFASDADNFLGFNNVSKNLNASPFTPDGNWSSSSSVTPENINVAIPVDNNMNRDVFVKNISTGAIQLVSQNYNGGAANGVSDQPSISTDGTKVVFRSFATNLTVELIKAVDAVKVQAASAYDNDIIYSILGNSRVFLNDLKTGTLSQLDILSDGRLPNGSSSNPQLSPDGNFVAFISDATNLVSNDNNGVADVFVKNLSTGELTKVSEDSTGTGNVVDFGFSGDSSTLAFSRLSGLEENATTNVYSVTVQASTEDVKPPVPPPDDKPIDKPIIVQPSITIELTNAKTYLQKNSSFIIANSGLQLFGNSGDNEVATIVAGAENVVLDGNIDEIVFANSIGENLGNFIAVTGASLADYKFKQSGNSLLVYDRSGTKLVVSIPVQDDDNGSLLSFAEGTFVTELAFKPSAGLLMMLNNTVIKSSTPTSVSPDGAVSFNSSKNVDALSLSKVYLKANDPITISNQGVDVFGSTGEEIATLGKSAKNVSFDQNVESLKFLQNLSDYKFAQAGNAVKIYDAAGTNEIAILPVQDEGSKLMFNDTNTDVTLSFSSKGLEIYLNDAKLTTMPSAIVSSNGNNINAAGVSNASGGDKKFFVSLGNYTHEIKNFQAGDSILFPSGQTPSLNNDNLKDGKVSLQYASNGQIAVIELTGLSNDASIGGLTSFKNVFGIGSISDF